MKKIFTFMLLAAALFTLPAENVQLKEKSGKYVKEGESRYAAGHFIVKMKKAPDVFAASQPSPANYHSKIYELCALNNVTIKNIKQLYPADIKNNTALYNKYEFGTYYVVYINEEKDIKELTESFSQSSKVDFAEPDFVGEAAGQKGYDNTKSFNTAMTPNDELFRKQWGLYNDGSVKTTTGKMAKKYADMNVLKAWDIETGSEDIIVAILDSGVKTDHPDISSRVWVNKNETKNGRDDDGNGFIDDINGFNFAYDTPNVKDDGGHGTNIAGTVGATTNNSLGYAGIDQKCRLMVCKNLDDENLGEYSWWSASLYYAANNGAKVINMSEGGYDYSKTLENAISFAYDAGALIVASMMNKNNGDSYYPASFKNVMAIGATDTDDARCREFTWGGGSNWGKHISVIAPGNRVYGLDYKDNYNYDVYWSGTSQATAYVSGFASVLLGQDPGRSNSDLRDIITSTAIDQCGDPREDTPGWDKYYGYGRVDLFEALNYGKSPSGKKEREDVKIPEYEEKEEIKTNNNGNKPKANDPDEDDQYRSKDEKRGRKPKPDENR